MENYQIICVQARRVITDVAVFIKQELGKVSTTDIETKS